MKSSRHTVRKHDRFKLTNTFVVNKEGVCRVFDLSRGGISFGCTNERTIPEKWQIDIIDDTGVHLTNLSMKTVWTAKNEDLNTASIYQIVVGAEFDNELTSGEHETLDRLFGIA